MTFQSQWGNLRVPTHPGGTYENPIYKGLDADNGLFLFTLNGKVNISETLGYSYVVSDTILNPIWKWLNGYCYFLYGSTCLWYSPTYSSWVLTITTTPGKPPIETWVWDDDTETTGSYTGDAFYTGTPPSLGNTSNFVARGSLRGSIKDAYSGTPIEVSTSYKYYKRDSEGSDICGVYIDQSDDVNPDITVGIPVYKDQLNNIYTRSLSKEFGNYTYGSIYYNTDVDKWIIGTPESTSGWYEGSEPQVDSSVIFIFTVPEDSEVEGDNLTITFYSYIIGDNTVDSYGFSIGKWHK